MEINQRGKAEKLCLNVGKHFAGGSGHEPFPIGFIGHGMLSTAVCGQIFTSPSVTRYLFGVYSSLRNILKIENFKTFK